MSILSEDQIKSHLQRHLQRGLVIVVGSGLSCAEGLPGMSELAAHIRQSDIAKASAQINKSEWDKVVDAIGKVGLEAALKSSGTDNAICDFIRAQAASLIIDRERAVVANVFRGQQKLQLSDLLEHLPQDGRLQIITTNYDRLIELAAEAAGFKVDTKAFGMYHAEFSKVGSSYAYCSRIEWHRKVPRLVEQKVVALYKPHGSLDWVAVNGKVVRSGFQIDAADCLIITPGQNKYRAGYNHPFDMQRELANQSIGEAQRFLVIGYGFNDDHLETHLVTRIKAGAPSVIMTHTLTDNARNLLPVSNNLMALESKIGDPNSTVVHFMQQSVELVGQQLWNPRGFVQGVMGP